MDGHQRFWAGIALLLFFSSAVLLLISALSTPALSWASYQSGGTQVYVDLASIAGPMGYAWIWYVPVAGVLLFVGYVFTREVEQGEDMGWRKRWIPLLGGFLILLFALVDAIVLGFQLNTELARQDLTFWNNIGGGWYSASTGAIVGLVAVGFRALVTKQKKGPAATPHRAPQQPQWSASEAPPPPPSEYAQPPMQAPFDQPAQSWPEYPAYQQQPATAAPPPSQYDQGTMPPAPVDQTPAPAPAAAAPKKKKGWFGK